MTDLCRRGIRDCRVSVAFVAAVSGDVGDGCEVLGSELLSNCANRSKTLAVAEGFEPYSATWSGAWKRLDLLKDITVIHTGYL